MRETLVWITSWEGVRFSLLPLSENCACWRSLLWKPSAFLYLFNIDARKTKTKRHAWHRREHSCDKLSEDPSVVRDQTLRNLHLVLSGVRNISSSAFLASFSSHQRNKAVSQDLFLQRFPHQQHVIEEYHNKPTSRDDPDDWYITAILLCWWHGAKQEVSYLNLLPVPIRWLSILSEKQKARTHVGEILPSTHDICLRNCTPVIIALKSKRRYVPGEMCLLQIKQ